jgi:hypothetical protein
MAAASPLFRKADLIDAIVIELEQHILCHAFGAELYCSIECAAMCFPELSLVAGEVVGIGGADDNSIL